MKRIVRPLSRLAVLALFAPLALWADVKLGSPFQDHMVLQQGRKLPVWGWADPGEKVTVSHRGQQAVATAGADGKWRVELPPLRASAEAQDFVVRGKNTLTLRDVLVGEVWLCSGQSNMAFTVNRALNAKEEMAAAKFPLIRQYAAKRVTAAQPQETVEGEWTVCAPETVGNFTAVGYYFARDLHQRLGVPVGLVHSSWGGTPAEAWTSEETLRADPAFRPIFDRAAAVLAAYPAAKAKYDAAAAQWREQQKAAKAAGKAFKKTAPRAPSGPDSPRNPAVLYNGMIRPLVGFALQGALWYQGEANAGHASEYRRLLSAMITQWRRAWAQGDFPFYLVQLANYKASGEQNVEWAFLREAQTQVATQLPHCGQALAIDIGDVQDIHPKNKQEVGRRLALLARAQVYGEKVESVGPTFARAERRGAGFKVTFTQAAGLQAKGGAAAGFELAGADRQFVPAQAVVQPDGSVHVEAAALQEPVAVRYAWRNAPAANLYSGAGLPAVPFRSDDWPQP